MRPDDFGSLQLGSSVAVGAPFDTVAGLAEAGAVHVYRHNGTAPVGTSVGIDASLTIYVGATGRNDPSYGRTGSVSVFKGYQFTPEMFPSLPRFFGDLCGASIAVEADGSRFVLGCPGSDGTTANEGAARVFTRTSPNVWTQTLLSYEYRFHGSDDLGRSVAIDGSRIFVGAPKHDVAPHPDHGAVEVFTNDPVFTNSFESASP